MLYILSTGYGVTEQRGGGVRGGRGVVCIYTDLRIFYHFPICVHNVRSYYEVT